MQGFTPNLQQFPSRKKSTLKISKKLSENSHSGNIKFFNYSFNTAYKTPKHKLAWKNLLNRRYTLQSDEAIAQKTGLLAADKENHTAMSNMTMDELDAVFLFLTNIKRGN